MKNKNNLYLKAVLHLPYSAELYKLVDFLNKNLKEKDIIFGLSKNDDGTVAFAIYENKNF